MRRIALLGIIGSLVVLAVVIGAGTSLATAPSGVGAIFTYRATVQPYHVDSNDFKIFQKNEEDVVMRQLTFAPGSNSGWHSHPGPVYVIVTQGSVVNYHADDPSCTGAKISAGQGFVETPGDIHMVRNEDATTTAVLVVTFTDVPVGGAYRLDAARPGNCPF
jgi:quercetin dioxygenase-like cupin family protein